MTTITRIPYQPERCFEFLMSSKAGSEYRILIAAPADPPPEGGYGVVYTLDGDALFQTLAETVKLQTRKPKGYDPILVVGIAYPSKVPYDMHRRCRDFTLPVAPETLPVRPGGEAWPPYGEADAFLDFLEQDLMPWVGKEWPIDSTRQAVVGHSLGGLLTLYALAIRPRLYSHYVAISPSVWWGEYEVLRQLERLKEAWCGEHPIHLMLAIGAEELPDMVEGAKKAAQCMEELSKRKVYTVLNEFAGEEHLSVLPGALGRIPRFLWSNLR
ncbi:alpha/beta hydrolase-fold protein [Paenibacillus phoenicis]|uniref:Alpha/beta hydrolase-fold protein n=1 Tax=Paenibacillus phoenicis TaxID=554117 RepID=A0ABU5PP68_9BACL|nr:alpha/beta hydrolase-fold protein [Paenibacillus phoenicis]MEA3571703.1 alpha/beta hydrolase-fold protein [Paenibacillus phoenicis]